MHQQKRKKKKNQVNKTANSIHIKLSNTPYATVQHCNEKRKTFLWWEEIKKEGQ